MIRERDAVVESAGQAHGRVTEVLEELVSVASVAKVFGEPVVAGDRTVITAAEIHTGMGLGYGLVEGTKGPDGQRSESEVTARMASWGRGRRGQGEESPRGGGGGGGQATGRPVAVVTIDPDGVHVEPILDRTKIVVTALTAASAIGLMLIRGRRVR